MGMYLSVERLIEKKGCIRFKTANGEVDFETAKYVDDGVFELKGYQVLVIKLMLVQFLLEEYHE